MTSTARRIEISHEGPRFREVITVRAESGTVALPWITAREITRLMESIAQAMRARENFRRARLMKKAREELGALRLTIPEGQAIRDYYLARFYNPKTPVRCHW